MKNLSSKIFLLTVGIVLFSCSKNDATTTAPSNQNFFNLNVGSKWVYKKYENSVNNPTQFTFAGIVDTVKIESIVNIQGLAFAKKSSKKVYLNDGTVLSKTYSYVRINNSGHLVKIYEGDNFNNVTETSGTVLHPINDYNYIFNDEIGMEVIYGNMEYKLYQPVNKLIEGNNYLVLPYNGVYTPTNNNPGLISKTVEYEYSKNIGLVRSVCPFVESNLVWEERLVEYHLN